jgi:hydrogenase maturation protein HypF
MLSRQVNSPFASSMGRLFDAVASIILAKKYARFEADLAIEMEAAAAAGACHKEPYRFKAEIMNGHVIFNPQPLFKGIIVDIKKGACRQEIACRFHQAIANMALDACRLAARGRKLKKVVLSGGVFQNNILLHACLGLLYKEGFKVLIHRKLSCSDAGISLGQAAVARFQKE